MPKDFGTPGPRAIYPDAVHSTSLAALSAEAERLFWRLLAQADDQGRLEGDATVMAALCLPRVQGMTPRRVSALLGELSTQRLIRLYAGGEFDHLVQIVTWWRWQAGMRRAYPSKWPAPEGWDDVVYGHGDGGPKTYREALALPRGARNLPAASPQLAGSVPAASPQLAGTLPIPPRAPAQPLPVPSAGAGAGATKKNGIESVPSAGGHAREAAEPEGLADVLG